jgi:hypothetical protein
VLKTYRKTKKYLFLGTAFDRDTDRMVANELTLDLEGGYFVKEGALTKREEKFLEKHNIELVNMSLDEFSKAFV